MKPHQHVAGFMVALLLMVGLVAVLGSPANDRAAPPAAAPRTAGPSTTSDVAAGPLDTVPIDLSGNLVAEPAPAPEPAPAVAEPSAPAPAPPAVPKVMLIGDSIAFTAALGLEPHAGSWSFTIANEGINGCGVVRGGPFRYFGGQRDAEQRCEEWPAAWQAALDRNRPDLVVIVVGRWELMDRVHEGRWTNLFDAGFAAYVEAEVDAAVALARSGGARIVIATSPYFRRGTTPSGGLYPEDDPARVDVINGILRRAAERHGALVVDLGGRLSPDGRYTRDVDGMRVRSDGVHLTRQTGDLLAPWLFPQLQQFLATPPPPPATTVPPPAPPAPPAVG